MRTITGVLVALLLAVVAYGALIEPRFLLDTEAFEAQLPDLPPAWEGKQVALLADFQIGMWGDNVGTVHEAIDEAVARDVALALIAGDFLYKPDDAAVAEAVDAVRRLTAAGIPTVVVLGNHDYSLMKESSERVDRYAEQLERELVGLGVRVLHNEAHPVVLDGDTLYVAGVGSLWAGDADVAATLAGVPRGAARLWLMHNPEAFREIPAEEAHLALAGHTHGGQIRFMPNPRNSWMDIVREREVATDGWAADSIGAPPNRLYINRGIGFSKIPVRINCRPELTLVTLREGNGDIPERGPG